MVEGVTLSYKKLWKMLIDKGISGSQLKEKAGVTTTVMSKLKKDIPVHLEALLKICKVLRCGLDEVVEVTVIKNDNI